MGSWELKRALRPKELRKDSDGGRGKQPVDKAVGSWRLIRILQPEELCEDSDSATAASRCGHPVLEDHQGAEQMRPLSRIGAGS